MSKRRASTEQFYNDIRAEYKKLSEIRKDGIRVYTQDYILNELAKKFYRSPKTIENIVFFRV